METAEGAGQEGRQRDNYYWWLPVVVVALFILAFETSPGLTPVAPKVIMQILDPVYTAYGGYF
jgi:hypothetical protein